MNRKQRRAVAGQRPSSRAEAERLNRQGLALIAQSESGAQDPALLQALRFFDQACRADSHSFETRNNQAAALLRAESHRQAAQASRAALALKPDYPQALHNFGLAMVGLGRSGEAAELFARAARLRPDDQSDLRQLGRALSRSDRSQEAESVTRTALAANPEDPEVWNDLGVALISQGRLEEGIAACREALSRDPDYGNALSNLAAALHDQGRFAEARAFAERAVQRQPTDAGSRNNLGAILLALGRTEAAAEAFRAAIGLSPDFAPCHYNLATALLASGQWREGWREYEWRWKGGVKGLTPRRLETPLWDGADPAGQTIFLHGEQGHGDILQFARYASILAGRGARVILEVYPPLKRVMATLSGGVRVIGSDEPPPACDWHLPLMSLPLHLGTDPSQLPMTAPYLAPPRDAVEAWRRRLPPLPGLKVGLVWAGGSPSQELRAKLTDRRRSLALTSLLPLLKIPGVSFVSLQMGDPARQIEEVPAGLKPFDPMAQVADFADTAALIANLDLIISVDTAVAHLAGAMGQPVWVLSRFDACWRWLQNRIDTPWYPTMRLFRQNEPGNWTGVVQEAAALLASIAGKIAQAPAPPSAAWTELFAQAVEHHRAGRLDDAEALYQQALRDGEASSGRPEILSNLGVLYRQQDDLEKAVACFREAVALRGDYAEAHSNLGLALQDQGLAAAALACHRNALVLQPTHARGWSNLGVLLQERREIQPAIHAYRRAIALEPKLPGAHYNLAQALLLKGDFREGWKEHEWLWQGGVEHLPQRSFRRPRWNGEDLRDRTILLHAEQGLGDTLQFIRYASAFAGLGAKVIVEAHAPLVGLLASVSGVGQVIACGQSLPDFDWHLPLMAAPHALGTTLDSIPNTVPYLGVGPDLCTKWRSVLGESPDPKVGLVWAGNSRLGDRRGMALDTRRSIPLAELAPLLALPGIRFVSLQTGPTRDQLMDLPVALRPIDPMEGVSELADTAAIIGALDLVVTVDTAVAHLAGALGKPVWILSRHDGCWRWLEHRSDSPWYPTARLFRQDRPGDWKPVIAQVVAQMSLLRPLPVEPIGHQKVLPDKPGRLFKAAVAHLADGRLEEAKRLYLEVLASVVGHADSLHHLGIIALRSGQLDEAAAWIEKAIVGRPAAADAYNNLGVVLREMDKVDQAVTRFRQAVVLAPDYADALSNLGNALGELTQWQESLRHYRRAQRLEPEHPRILSNLGVTLMHLGEVDEAVTAQRQALRLAPDLAETHYNLATALLLKGDYREGWAEYEWLWRGGAKGTEIREFSEPRWQGEDPKGRTILLYGEQGLGDVLQFVRYAPLIAARGARVILEVYRPLRRLLADLPGICQIVTRGDPLPAFDWQLPLMGAPHVLGTTLESIPSDGPYLQAPAERAAPWRDRLAGLPGLKIGLVWSGDPRPHDPRANAVDRRRSIRLSTLAPLLKLPGLSFVSLQKGTPAAQLDDIPQSLRPQNWMEEIDDFADTAALIAQLDLVITVDTSVAHLAGALGKPVWILSRFDGCWRWMLTREDSPWYPTARLFRQTTPGDWDPVVARVAAELAGLSPPANIPSPAEKARARSEMTVSLRAKRSNPATAAGPWIASPAAKEKQSGTGVPAYGPDHTGGDAGCHQFHPGRVDPPPVWN